ncbi:hypothetical protein [Nostoc sp. LEGE 12450]|uniref:hypothetical protein n=1 Tax=Nostoc sp. LEGE 12450 TaxID=1828643 RepID=UPI001882F06B|nr:hypothetical protein [Nostoc sp. LEGE 12450]MBE8989152.1 hypothetical protein [Nostoc sp. LEGE 12450]
MTNNTQVTTDELYHVFVPYQIAKQGGTQKFTSRTGKIYEVNIPANCTEGSQIRLDKTSSSFLNKISDLFSQKTVFNQKYSVITLHTLFEQNDNIDKMIFNLINNADIKLESKTRCSDIYTSLSNAEYKNDLSALELLDFIVDSAQSDTSFCRRYSIASQNFRLIAIAQCIDKSLEISKLNHFQKESIRGVFQCIRAGESISNFTSLKQLDSIVQNYSIPENIKQLYFNFSVKSKAMTTELLILDIINSVTASIYRSDLLSTYTKLRNGEQVNSSTDLKSLDALILGSNIPDDCKVIYKFMREPINSQKGKSAAESSVLETIQTVYQSVKKASNIVPNATTMAQATGIKAGTGVAISSLSGGAATNATLALLGGGSVAAGGLGMLGGLAVATGGAALIGAAALVSVASLTQMDSEDHKNLGIAAGAGVVTSAAAISTAWAAAGAFGVAGTGTAISTLSGAAAYSASMAFLGGVGVMTGGSALVAFGAGLIAWKFLKGDKNDPRKILKQLEAKLYS